MAKTAAQPHTDVLRPQDNTLENTEATFNKDYNATEREALKCATFLLSVFQSHPTLRNVCAEELPTAMLNFWMEAERKAEQAPQALPSPKAEEAVSEAGTFSQKENPEKAAQSLSETTSCNVPLSVPSETEPEAHCHEPAFSPLPSVSNAPEEAVDIVGNGVQNTEIVEQTENEKAFPLKPLFPKEKEKKESSLSSTPPRSASGPKADGERSSKTFSEPAAPTELACEDAEALADDTEATAEESEATTEESEAFAEDAEPFAEDSETFSEYSDAFAEDGEAVSEDGEPAEAIAPKALTSAKGRRRKKPRSRESYADWTEDDFCTAAQKHRPLLPDEEYELFVAYWTERDKKGLMHFQHCKTFSFERRMRTWLNKSKQIKREEERRLIAKYGLPPESAVAAPPTEEEVVDYATPRGIDADEARTFYFYYQAHSWNMRGQPIADWKAALALWMQRKSTRRRTETKPLTPNPQNPTNGPENSQKRFGRSSKAEANAEVDNFAQQLIDNERNKDTNPDSDFLSLLGDGNEPLFA